MILMMITCVLERAARKFRSLYGLEDAGKQVQHPEQAWFAQYVEPGKQIMPPNVLHALTLVSQPLHTWAN